MYIYIVILFILSIVFFLLSYVFSIFQEKFNFRSSFLENTNTIDIEVLDENNSNNVEYSDTPVIIKKIDIC